jgi:hypothetical protein
MRELIALTKRRDELLAELDGVERQKMITFIVDEAEPLSPIVLEISGERIVMSDVGNGASIRIAAGTPSAQCMHAIRLYERLAREAPSYMLLVVTPSGIPLYLAILQAIAAMPEESRPRIGIDLIPEGSFISNQFPSRGEPPPQPQPSGSGSGGRS